MKLKTIQALQKRVLADFGQRVGRADSNDLESVVARDIDKRLAVGYVKVGKDDYRLELRVQREGGLAHEAAENVKRDAKGNANIIVVEQITMPTQKEVQDVPGHSRLTAKQERLHLGLSVSHRDGVAGTLGALVETTAGDAILSACHVLALSGSAEENDWIYQPGKPDQKPLSATDRIGRLSNFVEFSRDALNTMDAAIATLKEGVAHDGNRIPDGLRCPRAGDRLTKTVDPTTLEVGTRVGKIGRTTGYTTGEITAVALGRKAVRSGAAGNLSFTNVMEVTWEAKDKPFTRPGDSGSLVFTLEPLAAVGLHFAGSRIAASGVGLSYTCDLEPILAHFHVSLLKSGT